MNKTTDTVPREAVVAAPIPIKHKKRLLTVFLIPLLTITFLLISIHAFALVSWSALSATAPVGTWGSLNFSGEVGNKAYFSYRYSDGGNRYKIYEKNLDTGNFTDKTPTGSWSAVTSMEAFNDNGYFTLRDAATNVYVVYEYSAGTWSDITPTSPVTATAGTVTVIDGHLHAFLKNPVSNSYELHQWSGSGTNWTNITPTPPAGQTWFSGKFMGTINGKSYLYFFCSCSGNHYTIYELNGTTLTDVTPATASYWSAVGSLSEFNNNGYLTLRNGATSEYSVHEYSAGTWSDISPTTPVTVTGGTVAVFDGKLHAFLKNPVSGSYELHQWSGSGNSWTEITPDEPSVSDIWWSGNYLGTVGTHDYIYFYCSTCGNEYRVYEVDGTTVTDVSSALLTTGYWRQVSTMVVMGDVGYLVMRELIGANNVYDVFEVDSTGTWTRNTPTGTWTAGSTLHEIGGRVYVSLQDTDWNLYEGAAPTPTNSTDVLCVADTTQTDGDMVAGTYTYNGSSSAFEKGSLSIEYNGGVWHMTGSSNADANEYTSDFVSESVVGILEASWTANGSYSAPLPTITEGACPVPAPEIDLQGNGQSIANGDTTATTGDDTDFGSTNVGGTSITHTFTISNSGDASLTLTGSPAVTLTMGTHFSVNVQPSSPVSSNSTTTFSVTFNPLEAGSFTDTINIANDDADENPYTFVISGTGFIIPPTVTTNAATAVSTEGATLNGTVNAHSDSTTVTFEYGTSTSYGTTVTADQSPIDSNSSTAVSKAITGLTPNMTYHYRVVGSNSAGTTYGDDMTFTTPANDPPVANAGTDQSVAPGAPVTLNGSGSSDPNNDSLTYSWTQIDGEAVVLDDSSAVSPTFTAPAVTGTLTFRLTVTDTGDLSDSDEVTITITNYTVFLPLVVNDN